MPWVNYECPTCGHKSKFEDEGFYINSINQPMYFIPKDTVPPRICEKCGDIMGRVA